MTVFCNGFQDAVVSSVIKKWNEKGTRKKLGRTILQKLIYFLKEKEVPLSFEYSLHYYGPYSQDLSESLQWLQAEDVVKDQSKGPDSAYVPGIKINEVIRLHSKELNKYDEQINFVVETFISKDSSQMELLATTFFVDHSAISAANIERTIREVKRIKGNKFTETEITEAVSFLKEKGFYAQ